MTKADILTLLESDLGYVFPAEPSSSQQIKIDSLKQEIDAAIAFIETEGIALPASDDDFCMADIFGAEDAQLIVMYAAYLHRKRATAEPMPRMLRWALNNRLFSEKARTANAT